MQPISIRYSFLPCRRTVMTDQVADLFGISHQQLPVTIADNLHLDIQPTDVVLFTGPSGSGKSSLMRAVGQQLNAVDASLLPLPKTSLVEAMPGPLVDRLNLLSACGLSEARLLLRTPDELSDGQRYRFRLAYALAQSAPMLLADEFAAYLDRVLAKVVSFNLRKLATKRQTGFLLATTHDDLVTDLSPDVHVQCLGEGHTRVCRHASARQPQPISFAAELSVSEGTTADWPYFAKWHYRSHHIAFVKRVVLLKHGEQPIGICVFTTPAASLSLRNYYFGLTGKRNRLSLTALNQQLWLLSRVVLHPTYRGAGLAAWFVRTACETCPIDWIETLTAMGHINPFFERAGFTNVGPIPTRDHPHQYGGQYGSKHPTCTPETIRKSQHTQPVYLVFDNRRKCG